MRFSRTTRAATGLLIVATMFLMLGMAYPQAMGDSDWVAHTSPNAMTGSLWDVDFVDETVGYAVDYSDDVWCTTDGGRTWEAKRVWTFLPPGTTVHLAGVEFVDASNGWAVGVYDPLIGTNTSAIYHTADGGESWSRQTISGTPSDALNAVDFYDAQHGFAVGQGGLTVNTNDGGATWNELIAASVNLNDVHMTSNITAYTVGENGNIRRWRYVEIIPLSEIAPQASIWLPTSLTSGVTSELSAVTFTDANHGYVTTSGKNILRTADGGDTWTSTLWDQFILTMEFMMDIDFVDADTGYAVGSRQLLASPWYGAVLVTTDGGLTWSHDKTGLTYEPEAVSMVSDSCGWTGGESGSMYKFGATNSDRLAGLSRYDTAMEISADAFADNSCDVVVVATGQDFADALSAAGLAGAYECPLLLTGDTLSTVLTDEIDRVGASMVVLVGGTAAIPQVVEDDLGTAGYTVDRVWGASRYETAANVAGRIADVTNAGEGFHQSVFIARGDSFADALAISPFAYSEKSPVLLVRPTSVPAETEVALTTLNIQAATLVGGELAISADTMDDIDDIIVTGNSGMSSDRWFGSSRYETAAVIAGKGLGAGFGDASYIGVATGMNFPDALGGGVACGRRGGVLLLTAPTALSPEVSTFISVNKEFDTSVRVFGGENAVDPAVLTAIDALF